MTEDVLYSFEDSSIIRNSVRRMLETGADPLGFQYSTGLMNLEEYIGNGLRGGCLYAVDGPEHMGKTAFLLTILSQVGVLRASPGIFFSLDHSIDQVIRQLLVMKSSRAVLKCFEKGGSEANEEDFKSLREAADILSSLNICLTDACGMADPIDIIQRLYYAKNKIRPSVIMIDGLDRYLRSPSEAKNTAKSLSNCARNLGIPILVTCGLKSTVRKRRGYEPLPEDFYWYSLYKEADVVLDLYRPSYYDPHESGTGARIRIMKNHFSDCGTAFMHYDTTHNLWEN